MIGKVAPYLKRDDIWCSLLIERRFSVNPLIHQLNWVQKNHPLQDKILLSPSYTEGYTLLESMVFAGYPVLNLRPETFSGLVYPFLLPHGQMVSNPVLDHLIWQILMDFAGREKLEYFLPENISYSLATAVRQALITLKEAQHTPEDLPITAFVSPHKGRDIQQIFTEYQYLLHKKGWYDTADIIQQAVYYYQNNRVETIFIIPEILNLTALQLHLVEILAQKTTCYQLQEPVIPDGPHMEWIVPRGLTPIPLSLEKKVSPLQFLYRVEDVPDGENVTFQLYSAYGISNEVQEVFRRIKEERLPFDGVAIYTSTQEPYHQLFYELASRFSIPITFGGGLRMVNFRPGRLFLALLEWIGDNFSVSRFIQILRSRDFDLADEKGPSPNQLIGILRQSNIGRYRERYSLLKEGSQDTGQKWAASFFQDLLGKIPLINQGGLIHYTSLLSGLYTILSEHSYISSPVDAQARSHLLDLLSQLQKVSSPLLTLDESLNRLKKMVTNIRVGHSSPQPGHLHIAHYLAGRFLSRRHLYFLGYDSTRFPGLAVEDPILLETERKKLGGLPLKSQRPIQNIIHLTRQLSPMEHPFTISYAAFDMVESRELFPSSFVLQLFRLLHQDPVMDYSTLQKKTGRSVGFSPEIPSSAVGQDECWLHYLISGRKGAAREQVLQHFPFLARGVAAWEKKNTGEFNAFLGYLMENPVVKNPVFSATRFETMGTCPYRYFLRYILGLKPLDELSYHPSSWLDPLTRGTLLHHIFESFYRQILERKELPSLKRHGSLLEDLVNREVEAMTNEIPIPSKVVYEAEVREINESAFLFLKSEEEATKELPVHLELSFGIGEQGGEESVEIQLPSGSFFSMAGRIDRVDKGEDGYIIIDYKTGSTYSYRYSDYLKGGRQLQHALYAIAYEEIRKKKTGESVSVIASGYVFPTLKGEGERFLRKQKDRDDLYAVLEVLLSFIREGCFPVTEDTRDCKFCDYPSICQREALSEAWDLLWLNHSKIQEFKVVRDYK